MSYTMKPSDASTRDRATNYAAMPRAASEVVDSKGGVRPCRNVGRDGSFREASRVDIARLVIYRSQHTA
jgi:hypothetical protein